jgi:hypothetical protein
MRRRVEAGQRELNLTCRICWKDLPEATRSEASELLASVLRQAARHQLKSEEAGDDK